MLIDEGNVARIVAALVQKSQSGGAVEAAVQWSVGAAPVVDGDFPSAAPAVERPVGPGAGLIARQVDGSSGGRSSEGDVAEVAGRLHECISGLMDVDAQKVAAGDALALLQSLTRERHRLDAAYLRAVALADQLDAAALAGGGSVQAYLKSVLGISPGRAKADVAAAHAIHGERSKELVPTGAAAPGTLAPLGELLADGSVSLAHVDVGVKTLENVPGRLLCADNLELITRFLATHAPVTTAQGIRVLSDRLIRALEPARDDHYDPESFNRRFFTMGTDITGMVHGQYQLDPAAGAQLRAIMDPLSAPRPDQKDEDGQVLAQDTRTAGQRRADALGELIRAGSTLLGPSTTGSALSGPSATGSTLSGPSSILPGAGGEPGLLRPEQSTGLQGDDTGLFELVDRGDGRVQSRAGKLRLSRRQARITIVTTMEQIRTMRQRRTDRSFGGQGQDLETFIPVDATPSYCDQLGPVCPGTLARMSCDGLFERVVLDAKGAVLDLGLAVRLASPAQRRAIAARDQGCIVPGCDRPPGWCEAHHIQWYSHQGPTDVQNLALFCPADHSRTHAGLIEAKMIDGIPYVRFTAQNGSTAAAAIPIGSIRHPEQTHWIRNGYFDRLKSG